MDARANEIATRFKSMGPILNERGLRIFAATEASIIGRGGVTLLHEITGLARSTIQRGQAELAAEAAAREAIQESTQLDPLSDISIPNPDSLAPAALPIGKVRRSGGGRKKLADHCPEWLDALMGLLEPVTMGDPESPLRWTIKSTKTLSEALRAQNYDV